MSVSEELSELRQACPGADSDFLIQALNRGWDTDQASRNWGQLQQAEITKLTHKVIELTAKVQQLEAEKLHAPEVPVFEAPKTDRPALQAFVSGVAAIVSTGVPRPQAIAKWCAENQEAHREYLDEARKAQGSKW